MRFTVMKMKPLYSVSERVVHLRLVLYTMRLCNLCRYSGLGFVG